MSTGYKINHAKDNAANYSISINMTTQLNSYHVAQDNIAMGMDLVTTASDTISLMQNKAERLRALCTQARNGTYGAQSMNAINGEANAIIAEINRIYMNAEYNGIKFFELANGVATAEAEENAGAGARAVNNMPEAKHNGFIENPTTYSKTQIDNMASIDSFTDGASGEFKIEDADDLAKLATIVDAAQNHSNATFVLANDIDLTDWQNQHGDWNPIGNNMYFFQGTFDGNGHVVKNLRITGSEVVVGLFACVFGGEIKNLGVINANLSGGLVAGGLVGQILVGSISNSYATGTVESEESAGGLVGILVDGTITDSYATGNVNATQMSGGLVGGLGSDSAPCSVSDSYAYGTVTGTGFVGSLVGELANSDGSANTANFSITNCQTVAQACDPIGGLTDGNTMVPIVADLTPLLAGITVLAERPTLGGGTGSTGAGINLQVGIYGNQSCGITLNTGFSYDLSALTGGIESDGALQAIDDFINLLSDKATHFGAVQNRLESALDSIEVKIMNLTSSRSTIRDADMAELSSTYIQQQILQEASATLMATANQMPAIALQLL